MKVTEANFKLVTESPPGTHLMVTESFVRDDVLVGVCGHTGPGTYVGIPGKVNCPKCLEKIMMKGHCKDGFCSTTYRMGGCECDCEMCMEAMRGEPEEAPELRAHQPVEVLTGITGPKPRCLHCSKGIVEIMRDSRTMALRWDVVYCLLCGQRYNIQQEDREKFMGYDYTQELFGKVMS